MMTHSEAIPWHALARRPQHRTSAPTTAELRHAIAQVTLLRRGGAPTADVVIFAALRLAGMEALAREVAKIESERFRE